MSFALWHDRPPFPVDLPEVLYSVGGKWVVTDQGQPMQAQIDALLPSPNAAIDAQIEALETAQLLPRVTREYFLADLVAKAALQGYTEPQLYAASAAYKRLKDFDGRIAALRTQRV